MTIFHTIVTKLQDLFSTSESVQIFDAANADRSNVRECGHDFKSERVRNPDAVIDHCWKCNEMRGYEI